MKKYYGFVLIFIVAVLAGYFLLNSKEKDNYIEVSINDSIVRELYNNFNMCNSYDTVKELYDKQIIGDRYKIASSLNKAYEEGNNIITEEELRIYNKKLFVEDIKESNRDIFKCSKICGYEKSNNIYNINTICNTNINRYVLTNLVKAKKSLTDYILSINPIFVIEENNTLKIYSDSNYENLIDEAYKNTINFDKYTNKLSMYELHYMFDGESFILKNISKI